VRKLPCELIESRSWRGSRVRGRRFGPKGGHWEKSLEAEATGQAATAGNFSGRGACQVDYRCLNGEGSQMGWFYFRGRLSHRGMRWGESVAEDETCGDARMSMDVDCR
jgi:hypothetical protein